MQVLYGQVVHDLARRRVCAEVRRTCALGHAVRTHAPQRRAGSGRGGRAPRSEGSWRVSCQLQGLLPARGWACTLVAPQPKLNCCKTRHGGRRHQRPPSALVCHYRKAGCRCIELNLLQAPAPPPTLEPPHVAGRHRLVVVQHHAHRVDLRTRTGERTPAVATKAVRAPGKDGGGPCRVAGWLAPSVSLGPCVLACGAADTARFSRGCTSRAVGLSPPLPLLAPPSLSSLHTRRAASPRATAIVIGACSRCDSSVMYERQASTQTAAIGSRTEPCEASCGQRELPRSSSTAAVRPVAADRPSASPATWHVPVSG